MHYDVLMQEIQRAAGFEYMSDMKQADNRRQVMEGIKKMPLLNHELAAWEYAFAYIFGEPVEINSVDRLVAFVRTWHE